MKMELLCYVTGNTGYQELVTGQSVITLVVHLLAL